MAGTNQTLTRVGASSQFAWLWQTAWEGRKSVQPFVIAVASALIAWEVLGRCLRFPFLPPFTQVLEVIGQQLRDSLAKNRFGAVCVSHSFPSE